jgi:hypothetical protein
VFRASRRPGFHGAKRSAASDRPVNTSTEASAVAKDQPAIQSGVDVFVGVLSEADFIWRVYANRDTSDGVRDCRVFTSA